MRYKYFDELKSGGKYARHLEDNIEKLKAIDEWWTKPELQTSISYLSNELQKTLKQAGLYKLTDSINPKGEDIHIPEDFAYCMDLEEIDGSVKFYAGVALLDMNEYYRYLNRLSIEKNKYPKHRRDILKLDPDIKLPRTPKEILITFEDQASHLDRDGYRCFLNSFGSIRGPRRNPLEKFIKKLVNSIERR